MKKTILILLLASFSYLHAQQPSFINASTASWIYMMDFDKSNNGYVAGAVQGRIYINGQYKDYTNKSQWIVARMDGENFKWIIELDGLPRDFAVINETVYLLTQERIKEDNSDTYSLIIHSYDLMGNLKDKKSVVSIKGTKYEVFTDGKFFEGGVLTWSTWKEDGSVATLDGANLKKTLHGQYVYGFYDYSGNKKWTYTMEAGIDNFTTLSQQDVEQDAMGNTYILSEYGAKANTGTDTYTTDIMHANKTLPLYYKKSFLIKLNNTGKPEKCAIVFENSITAEDMLIDAAGNIYVAGYHRGNDAYAKTLDVDMTKNHIGGRFFGRGFIYTTNEKTDFNEEHGFIGKVDPQWNFLWCNNLKGTGNVRVTTIVNTATGIAISGNYTNNVEINGINYAAHPQNAGYSDSYYASLNSNGEFGSILNFQAAKSNFVTVYQDANGRSLIAGSMQEKSVIINGTEYTCNAYWNAAFLYRPN